MHIRAPATPAQPHCVSVPREGSVRAKDPESASSATQVRRFHRRVRTGDVAFDGCRQMVLSARARCPSGCGICASVWRPLRELSLFCISRVFRGLQKYLGATSTCLGAWVALCLCLDSLATSGYRCRRAASASRHKTTFRAMSRFSVLFSVGSASKGSILTAMLHPSERKAGSGGAADVERIHSSERHTSPHSQRKHGENALDTKKPTSRRASASYSIPDAVSTHHNVTRRG